VTRASVDRRHRRSERDPNKAITAKIDRFRSGKSHAHPDRVSRQIIERAWAEAHRRTNQSLGTSVRRLFALKIVPDGSDFATIDSGQNPYPVRVSAGLPGFIYRISRLLAARCHSTQGDPANMGSDDETGMPYEESVERINRAFFWYSAARGSTIHQDFPITDGQAVIGGMLASEAEVFLLCHEIAHGLMADIPEDAGGLMAELRTGLEAFSPDWREEFMADRLALLLAFGKREGPRDGDDLARRYAGWEFALLLHREWERYEALIGANVMWSDSHPPAAERLENLRGTLRLCVGADAVGRILSFADALSTVFSGLVDTIFSDDFRTALVARDQLRVARLGELAHAYAAGVVPDYAQFVPEAADILVQAESWILLQLVSDATASIRGEIELDQTNFAIAKLVWRTCEDLPDPVYSVFKKVTELSDLGSRRQVETLSKSSRGPGKKGHKRAAASVATSGLASL
jgi:hypothetical protein